MLSLESFTTERKFPPMKAGDGMFTVYELRHVASGKRYIGKTNNMRMRMYDHKRAKGTCPKLHRAIKKYGPESFSVRQIQTFDCEDSAYIMEERLIELYDAVDKGYNTSRGGACTTAGIPKSEETKRKLREAHIGKTLSEDTKEKIRKSLKEARKHGWNPKSRLGKKNSPEHVANIKKALTPDAISRSVEKRRKIKESEWPQIFEMRSQGVSFEEIATQYGVTHYAIRYIVKKFKERSQTEET